MKLLHAASRSGCRRAVATIFFQHQARRGSGSMSGVIVLTMIKSMSAPVTPAIFIARSAACATFEVNSVRRDAPFPDARTRRDPFIGRFQTIFFQFQIGEDSGRHTGNRRRRLEQLRSGNG